MKIQPKILVVGSFVMDQIAETSVFPQEGQTVLGEKFSKAPGGKGANQAVQAARLGASVTMAGKLGKDASGAEMIEACRAEGISTEHICWDPERPSGHYPGKRRRGAGAQPDYCSAGSEHEPFCGGSVLLGDGHRAV